MLDENTGTVDPEHKLHTAPRAVPDVLWITIHLLMCKLADAIPQPPRRGKRGQPDTPYVVPMEYKFKQPCPFGRTAPGAPCLSCIYRDTDVRWVRPVTEPEADKIVDAYEARHKPKK